MATEFKMNIKKGDEVKVITGKDKGKTGKVLQVFPKDRKVVAEGINTHSRFTKPKKQGEKGQKMQFPAAMPVAKLMLVCPNCGKPTRVGKEVTDSGTFRKCKLCGKTMK